MLFSSVCFFLSSQLCAFNTVVQRDDLRPPLESRPHAPLAAVQALALVVIPRTSGAAATATAPLSASLYSAPFTASCNIKKRKNTKKTRKKSGERCSEAASEADSKTHVDVKAALKFMEPVIKREGLLPNRRPWRKFFRIISSFIFTPVAAPSHREHSAWSRVFFFLPQCQFFFFCFLQRLHRVLTTLRLDVCSLFEVQPAGSGAWRSLSPKKRKKERRAGHGRRWRTRRPFLCASSLLCRPHTFCWKKTSKKIRHWLSDSGSDLFVVACRTSAAPLRLRGRPQVLSHPLRLFIYSARPLPLLCLIHFTLFARKVVPVTNSSLSVTQVARKLKIEEVKLNLKKKKHFDVD